ncbi:cell wall metabolism sensor histidine kinase WalK [Caryophanon tenue]|uniref:histidine kinase n=1 Tax=Caryophanon tenue TaxID=33978 RepID=A0A1C0YL87_9BACL|nr:cell wall metabolism sensor histidine kinase WalK [Caryophanon tenue]OCS87920.1 PAS domain-containing sensor histidine kinase [Caryophanon tenue]
MPKVKFLKSIHVKIVVIYILLIVLAMQIIGLYFIKELEHNLKENFMESINNRVELVKYNVSEEMQRERDETTVSQESSLNEVLSGFASNDILDARVLNDQYRVLGTAKNSSRSKVGQYVENEAIEKVVKSGEQYDVITVDENTKKRVWVLIVPVMTNDKVIGVLYIESDIEKVYDNMNEINGILALGTLIALCITIVLGTLIARTITRPISDMRRQAQALAKGNFSRKVRVYGSDEIGQLAIAFNNLTNRLQEAHSTTEAERRKLASVLTNMTDGVIATDRKGRIILINDPALQLLQFERTETLNRPIISVLGLDQDYEFEDLIHMKDSVNLNFSTQDIPYILRANFSVIQKESGFVNGLITVLHDITEQEKIEMERREFVANVSHELRTPLTTMRSYLDALADGAWQDENIAPTFLNVTQTETERMIRLVNDLLQLSKMDSQDYQFNKEVVEFNRFFERIIDRFEMSKSQNVDFIRLLPEQSYFVEIDTDKLTQVIDNIISNAMKYSPDGGYIRFGFTVQDTFLKVMISDDGMGIPKENLTRIFDRFYRVDRARARSMGGTGLGLAIAKEMIQAHGGQIWAESEEGHGTTIFFTLPYQEMDDEVGDWD